jgi:hypothetical protein
VTIGQMKALGDQRQIGRWPVQRLLPTGQALFYLEGWDAQRQRRLAVLTQQTALQAHDDAERAIIGRQLR